MKVTFDIPEKIMRKAIFSVMAEDDDNKLPEDFATQVMAKENIECCIPKVVGLKQTYEMQTAIALMAVGMMAAELTQKK